MTPLNVIAASMLGYGLACLLGVILAATRKPRLWNYSVHLLTAVSSAAVAASSLYVFVKAETLKAVVTFPGALSFLPPLHILLDPLSAFMVFVISLVSLYTSIFAMGYVDEYYYSAGKMAVLGLCLPAFIASMILVALAGDAILFIIMWEVMSITSFFLILTDFESEDVRRAATIYMIYAAFSAACLLASFALGYVFTGSYVFSEWRGATLSAVKAALVFFLAFLGFAAKGGVVPLHSWLPYAHPAAPSHVSALLSGVMVKLAMYGIARLALDVLAPWASVGWAVVVVALGAISTFYGVALAIIQHDIKRLLAYHTIENIGIIMLGLGVAIGAYAIGDTRLAVLGIIAGLFHLLNHALFKSLLFLCSGALLHQVHTRDIEHMGGLYRAMRATAIAFLVASLGIAAIPLFNGFASEWCTYSSLMLAAAARGDVVFRFVSLFSIVSLAAAGVLAVYCFTKVFGLVFLGMPRSEHAREASSEPLAMKAGYVLPALLIVLLGLAPGLMVSPLAKLGGGLVGETVAPSKVPLLGVLVTLWRTPSAYIPLVIAAIIAAIAVILWASSISKVRFELVTEPFVSGAEYGREMTPTAALYVGTLEDVMAKLYGVRKVYRREYAVAYWVTKLVEVLELPYGLQAVITRQLSRIVRGLPATTEKFDDMFYAVAKLVGAAYARLADAAKRLQCGSLHIYLLYVYVAFFVLIAYYVLAG